MKYICIILLVIGAVLKTKPNTTLINILDIIPSIKLDIRYATTDNFTGKQVYSHAVCFLQEPVARKLGKAQQELHKLGLGLKIFDGYRPLAVQKEMFKIVPDTRYVADPQKGSRHNRGAAVDVTLVDSHGNELEMPCAFDGFSIKAHRNCKIISAKARKNSKLLEKVMHKHGFIGMLTEWWHFDDKQWQKYPILDISFDQLLAVNTTKIDKQ